MEPFVKLKIDCNRVIKDTDDYDKKFRFALGAPGFLNFKDDPKKSNLDLFQDLEDRGYYKRKNVNILYWIFSVMEMNDCLDLVVEYMRKYAPPGGEIPAPVREPPTPRETIQISDAYIFEICKKIPIGNLSELAVLGFSLPRIEHENLIREKSSSKDKIMETLLLWQRRAPLSGTVSEIPPFNKLGLRQALEEANLNGVISDLKLHLL